MCIRDRPQAPGTDELEQDLGRLLPGSERELRELARCLLRRGSGPHAPRTTSLVHEAYLRLARLGPARCPDRARFLALAARAMRSTLVDRARRRMALKRSAGAEVPFDEALDVRERPDVDVLAVHEALDELAQVDVRKARVVELRFFGGLGVEETAEALRTSVSTVAREWRMARAWLLARLGPR